MKLNQNQTGIERWEMLCIVLILGFATAVLYPVYSRMHEAWNLQSCQSNMKDLGTALHFYMQEYNGTLPSSGGDAWNVTRSKRFCTVRGTLPPPPKAENATWPMLLYPYLSEHKDEIWCPSDRNDRQDTNSQVSYWYKPAVDRAWFGGEDNNGGKWQCRKENDFKFEANQIIFFERAGWHWSDQANGLANGTTLSAAFVDGHVQSIRLKNSGNSAGKSNLFVAGEPGWFNYDYKKTKALAAGRHFDPRRQGDNLH